ncbi:flavin reductase family protein [Altibacter sp. HG106]|uniref:flavin reductase family protein n=1 Tax=Altibacter sp. HG106 TaxID=3023937 RepID=UPI002350E19F|nr:flavin reductase family protein [Altibacter sp. HG106]MDC7995234.1 flavin reductase family protein [Altibacter sp. HG106]
MLSVDPKEISTKQLHGYLLGAVAPRPICFASTVDASGRVNLAPYSFFNVFGSNPPIMIFSPARRVRDNTTKHTLENVLTTKEVVINIVSYAMVQQMSLSSTEYPQGVNEFIKAGFTEAPSEVVAPPRVAEAPVQFECKVTEVIATGTDGGAGNLILAEVVRLHVKEAILDDAGGIDPQKIDTVARMGGNWYSRAKEGMFEVPKPLSTLGIGVDALPETIRTSAYLTGNDLGMLGNVEALPAAQAISTFKETASESYQYLITSGTNKEVHEEAQRLLGDGKVSEAWLLLMAAMKTNHSE